MKKILIAALLIRLVTVQPVAQVSSELSGRVTWTNNTPVPGAVLLIGKYSVAADKTGVYKFRSLKPGAYTVIVSPPQKTSRSFRVIVTGQATQRNFTVNW